MFVVWNEVVRFTGADFSMTNLAKIFWSIVIQLLVSLGVPVLGQEQVGNFGTAPPQRRPLNGRVDLLRDGTESKPSTAGSALLAPVNQVPLQGSTYRNEFRMRTGLAGVHTIVVLDCSGSQSMTLSSGAMQMLLNRLCPLVLDITGEQELETWAYADRTAHLPPITASNLPLYMQNNVYNRISAKLVAQPLKLSLFPRCRKNRSNTSHLQLAGGPEFLGAGQNEGAIMTALQLEVARQTSAATSAVKPPTLVLFITDGGVQRQEVAQALMVSSSLPIFWQFVCFHSTLIPRFMDSAPPFQRCANSGHDDFGGVFRWVEDRTMGRRLMETVLPGQNTDYRGMQAQITANSGFCAVDDFPVFSDQQLEHLLFWKFPTWVNSRAGLAQGN